nr:hypothetical protein [Tanacetum cinerariifolium]
LERRARHVAGRLRAGRVRVHAGQPADPHRRRTADHRRPGRPGYFRIRCLRTGHQSGHRSDRRAGRTQEAAAVPDLADDRL